MDFKEKSLHYHNKPFPGKLSVEASKICNTQEHLSFAYTPGVAYPCLEIAENEEMSYEYTGKGNLVGVISDGSAVLGLGNIGASAGKPVMEGKALLFKKFADVNAFDLEINESNPQKLIEIIKSLEPTFGGINLEDINSPRCFEIEEKLKQIMDIPVFHDDQHGTAVIAGAAVLNGLEIAGKDIKNVKIVISGAGAAGVAVSKHLINLGANPENLFCFDKSGVLYKGRADTVSPWHDFLFRETESRSLKELMSGADIFIGVSVKGLVSEEMVAVMAPNPIIFPMANPDPEITYDDVKKTRPDAIIGTGRSDFPNQVNNVLGFPAIFRGALDIRAKSITENMKIAASKALAELAKKPVPKDVLRAYNLKELNFGRDYLIPKPFDKRVLLEVATAVALAGISDGVHRKELDILKYRRFLKEKFVIEE